MSGLEKNRDIFGTENLGHLRTLAQETPKLHGVYTEFQRTSMRAAFFSLGTKRLISISEAIWVLVGVAAGAGPSHAGFLAALLEITPTYQESKFFHKCELESR